jgi:phospholipid/cholesterol/gamma-HCH transport system permease protein
MVHDQQVLDQQLGWVIIGFGMKGKTEITGWALGVLREIGEFILTSAETIVSCFRPPFRGMLIIQQMEFIGVGSLFIVLLTGMFAGAVFTLQTLHALSIFNMENRVGSMVTLAVTRELAPVLASLMITGRAGSAMATELGTMRVTEQIDAMASMAINPVHYLFVPRFLASLVMFPALAMCFNMVAVVGSYIVAVQMWGVDPGHFMTKIIWFVQANDILSGLIKATVFGGFIALISCFKGYRAEGGARGVGTATTRAVVIGSVSIMIMDYFLTVLMF